jgi:putative two-component system response regulator
MNQSKGIREIAMPKKKLLVVDEEPQIVESLRETFAAQYEVLVAKSGEEAIRRAVLEHPNCILLDIMMPQLGGFMLCEILKSIKQTKLLPVLFMGVKPRHEVWATAQELGALDYLEKPFPMSKASDAVTCALQVAPVERRRSPRLSLKVPITVRGKDIHGNKIEVGVETVDVTRYGALMRLPVQIAVGQEVEICQSYLPESGELAVRTMARVVWIDEEGVIGPYWHGMEFVSPSSQWLEQR